MLKCHEQVSVPYHKNSFSILSVYLNSLHISCHVVATQPGGVPIFQQQKDEGRTRCFPHAGMMDWTSAKCDSQHAVIWLWFVSEKTAVRNLCSLYAAEHAAYKILFFSFIYTHTLLRSQNCGVRTGVASDEDKNGDIEKSHESESDHITIKPLWVFQFANRVSKQPPSCLCYIAVPIGEKG